MRQQNEKYAPQPLFEICVPIWQIALGLGIFSLFIVLLRLVSLPHILHVFDRGLTRHSVGTLVGLSVIGFFSVNVLGYWAIIADGLLPGVVRASGLRLIRNWHQFHLRQSIVSPLATRFDQTTLARTDKTPAAASMIDSLFASISGYVRKAFRET